MAVKYIKTKITHIRSADPVLRLLAIPLPPLGVQVCCTHAGVCSVYLPAVVLPHSELSNSVSLSLSSSVQTAGSDLSLCGPARLWCPLSTQHHHQHHHMYSATAAA